MQRGILVAEDKRSWRRIFRHFCLDNAFPFEAPEDNDELVTFLDAPRLDIRVLILDLFLDSDRSLVWSSMIGRRVKHQFPEALIVIVSGEIDVIEISEVEELFGFAADIIVDKHRFDPSLLASRVELHLADPAER